MSASLLLENLSKVFRANGQDVAAVKGVNCEIRQGEFFTMLGPSGCGKTTTLRMIAGLETISEGRILLGGQDITGLSAYERSIGMVFQSYALFPHMSVFENTAYGLRLRGVDRAAIAARVGSILGMLDLADLARRYPAELSGGQQQRVSIARALVYEPRLLLLDEPLANLDAKLRVQMREEIRRVQKDLGVMAIYVTHDQEEAMSVSDRIGVFNKGQLMQVGAPAEIYSRPNCLFVADFIGAANFFDVAAGSGAVSAPGIGSVTPGLTFETPEGSARLMVRPECMEISPTGPGIPCRVRRMQFLGSFVRYAATCDLSERDVLIETQRPVDGVGEASSAFLRFSGEDAVLYRGGAR